MNKNNLLNILLFLNLLCSSLASYADIWIKNNNIKQGDIITITGLYLEFDKKYSFLDKCFINFQNNNYKFFKDIISYEEFKESNSQEGFQYITRLASTPLSKVGKEKILIKCPLGEKFFYINIEKEDFPIQHIKLSKEKSSLEASEKELSLVKNTLQIKSPYKLWNDSFKWIKPSNTYISTNYGLRRTYNGVLAEDYFHKGYDFAAKAGSIIKAPANGKVILIGKEKNGFNIHGNCIFLDHGQSIITVYLHLSEILVSEGQNIKQGEIIGKVGDSGIATGAHLHFGISTGHYLGAGTSGYSSWSKFIASSVNPMNYIPPVTSWSSRY